MATATTTTTTATTTSSIASFLVPDVLIPVERPSEPKAVPSVHRKPRAGTRIDFKKRAETVSREELYSCVYQVTCTDTGLSYVGQAILAKYKDGLWYAYGPKGRWSDHVSSATNSSREQLIFGVIRQHGKEAFKLKILELVLLDRIDECETKWIRQLGTIYPNGYNEQIGGGNKHTQNRIDLVEERLADENTSVESVTSEDLKKWMDEIQADLDDPMYERLKPFMDLDVVKIRVATSKGRGASRQDGNEPGYTKVTVFVYPRGVLAKDVPRSSFGGVSLSVEEAHAQAMKFANRIGADKKVTVLDQVKL